MAMASRRAQVGRFAPARVVAVLPLAVAGALVALSVVSVLPLARRSSPPTVPADLGAIAQGAIPVREPMALGEAAGLWLLRGDATLHNARVQAYPRRKGEGIADWAPQPLHSVERIELTGGRLWLNSGRTPKARHSRGDDGGAFYVFDVLRRLAFETLVVKGAQVTTQRATTGLQTFEHLDAEIQAAPDLGIVSATGAFQHRGERLQFTAAFRPATTKAGKWNLPARITIDSRLFAATFDGVVQFDRGGLRLDGMLEVSADRLSSLAQWLGVPLPAGVEGRSLSMRGDAAWREGVLTFDTVHAQMDGQVAHGTLNLSIAGRRPFLDGALAFQTLSAGPVMTWLGLGLAPPAPTPPGAAHIPERAARATLFDDIDADLRLSVTAFKGGAAEAANAAVSLTAKDGIVVADIADAEFGNGLISGQFRIDQRGPKARWRSFGSLKNVETDAIGALLPPGIERPLTGLATVTFDLTGRGRTAEEVGATLDGDVGLSMTSGGTMLLDLPSLLADARERKSFPLTSHQPKRGAFEQFEAKLGLRQGALLTEDVTLRQDGARITVDGTVQAAKGRIYLRLLTDHGQGLARTARIGRSQSVLLYGDLTDPMVLLEDTPVAAPPPTAAAAAPMAKPAER